MWINRVSIYIYILYICRYSAFVVPSKHINIFLRLLCFFIFRMIFARYPWPFFLHDSSKSFMRYIRIHLQGLENLHFFITFFIYVLLPLTFSIHNNSCPLVHMMNYSCLSFSTLVQKLLSNSYMYFNIFTKYL